MSDFSKIGLHLDLRAQVPPMPALRRIANEAVELGVNTLIVEWEASFPFDRHAVISHGRAYTPEEVTGFLEECRSQGLDVIPLQQCFGHVEYILRHDRYAGLREDISDLCQVCPCQSDDAVAVFRDIFQEVAALHASSYFHIGGDETYLLGRCPKCRARAEKEGKSRLYVDYFKRLAQEVIHLGKRPLLWIDMLLKYPEAAAEMPRECIFIDWNYGWPVDRFGDFHALSTLPFEFWGAVAMRSAPDNHSSHAWVTHLKNLRDYLPVARAMKFEGLITTSWSTSGVYGYEWEMPGRPLALHPVRRVTPHVGMRLLMDAFSAAVHQEEPLDERAFLVRYARERFGFDQAEAEKFREALLQSDRSAGQGSSSGRQERNLLKARTLMVQLKPRKYAREFERYRLLVDFTEFQERLALLEAQIQSEKYTLRSKRKFHQDALSFLREGEGLEERFGQLYEGELYPEELREESRYRMKRVRNLAEQTESRVTPLDRVTEDPREKASSQTQSVAEGYELIGSAT